MEQDKLFEGFRLAHTMIRVKNLDLSLKRAKSVAEYMSKHGLENAIVKGVGEQFPIESNDTKQGRARNRRVELHFD